MFDVKFVLSSATYSIGEATEHGCIMWLTDNDIWTEDFENAAFFDSEAVAKVKLQEILDFNERRRFRTCLSIVAVCWNE